MRWAAIALCVGLGACARDARFATTDPNEPMPNSRRAPGVLSDPVSRLPAAQSNAEADDALLVLSAPHSVGLARSTLARFFRALVNESPEGVDAVLTEQASIESTSGKQPARGALRSRFVQLDYGPLRGVPLFRDNDVEVYRFEDAERLRTARALPTELSRGDLLVRVRLSVSYAGKTRVLADHMDFLLRPERTQYRIATIHEDTQVP